MNRDQYFEFLERVQSQDQYWVESAITDFTEELCRLMDEQNVSRAELARRLSCQPAYITKVLRGNANFTLETMTKLARALNSIVHVHLAPRRIVVSRLIPMAT